MTQDDQPPDDQDKGPKKAYTGLLAPKSTKPLKVGKATLHPYGMSASGKPLPKRSFVILGGFRKPVPPKGD